RAPPSRAERRGGRRSRSARPQRAQRRGARAQGAGAARARRRAADRDSRWRRLGGTTDRRRAMTWVMVAAIGVAAGIVSGLFGVGGAIVIIPGLVLLLGMSQHAANGTSLAALLLPVGLLGTLEYYRRGEVNLPYAFVIA